MKTLINTLVVLWLAFPIHTMYAQASWEELLEKDWKGASRSVSNDTKSGYFYCTEYLYDVEYNSSNNTFIAFSKTVFNYNGVDYISIWDVDGIVDIVNNKLTLKPIKKIRADKLPNGLYWTPENIYLTFYTNTLHEGYYILKGKTEGMSYSDESYYLEDYPYY